MFQPIPLNRRRFLRNASLVTLPFLFGDQLLTAKPDPEKLIVRGMNPDNLEFPFASLNSFLTPNELFYVRNHFAAPNINAAAWRLQVVGAVGEPLNLTYDAVKALPSTKLPMTLECAGNGRSFL